MPPNKYLSCLCLVIASGSVWAQTQAPCKSIDAEIKITATTNGSDSGEVQILTSTPIDPLIHLISKEKDRSLYHHKSLTITSLARGRYDLLISDAKEKVCPIHKKVTIE